MIHLDTHVVVWLYEKKRELFSAKALTLINGEDLAISPMVVLELQYLFEIDRIRARAKVIFDYLHDYIGLAQDTASFQRVSEKALELSWTRDPFDRLIVAQASCQSARLLTKDTQIRKNFSSAVWED